MRSPPPEPTQLVADSALRGLQRDFHDFVTRGQTRIAGAIAAPDEATRDIRLAVYGDAYYLRLAEALETDFTALAAMLGQDSFTDLTRRYAAAHPSQHPSIRWFGRHLADFMAGTAPYATRPEWVEMARFEWAVSLCFDAPDADTLGVEHFAGIPGERWPELRFGFHPSLHRLDLDWNVPVVRKALLEQDTEAVAPTRNEYSRAWLLWRGELNPHYRSLDVHQAWMLDSARQGLNFAALCDGLTEWIDPQHAAPEAAAQLKQWVVDGLITSAAIPEGG
jgi:hypothetical protein